MERTKDLFEVWNTPEMLDTKSTRCLVSRRILADLNYTMMDMFTYLYPEDDYKDG